MNIPLRSIALAALALACLGFGVDAQVQATARGQGYYVLVVDSVDVSNHVAEREAIEAGTNVLFGDSSAVVWIEHRYTVDLALDRSALPRDTVFVGDSVAVRPDTVLVPSGPAPPASVAAAVTSDSMLAVSWDSVPDASRYRLSYGSRMAGEARTVVEVFGEVYQTPIGIDGGACVQSVVRDTVSGTETCDSFTMPTRPERVDDLFVAGVTETSVRVGVPLVDDGLGNAANFDLRWGPIDFAWASAYPDRSQTLFDHDFEITAAPGDTVFMTVADLNPDSTYELRGVGFRGVPNFSAVFGPVSNAVEVTTPAPAPEPDSAIWILDTDDPDGPAWIHGATLTLTVGETRFLCGYLLDEATRPVTPYAKSSTSCPDDAVGGAGIPVIPFQWCSSNPTVAAFLDPTTGEPITESCGELRGGDSSDLLFLIPPSFRGT